MKKKLDKLFFNVILTATMIIFWGGLTLLWIKTGAGL